MFARERLVGAHVSTGQSADNHHKQDLTTAGTTRKKIEKTDKPVKIATHWMAKFRILTRSFFPYFGGYWLPTISTKTVVPSGFGE